MATTCMSEIYSTPLSQHLSLGDLRKCGELYNTLIDDSRQPAVTDDIIADLASIFVRHNAQKVLGLHLIHGHLQIPPDTVLVGTTFRNHGLRWTKPTLIEIVDSTETHGHVYVVTKHGLIPYELESGPLPELNGIGEGFLQEFVEYLFKHDLTNLLGLQVLGCGDTTMLELILDEGTVMIEENRAKNVQPTRITGWKFESVDGRPRVCAANETHSTMTTGNHKVFNVGKPLPKLENVEDLKIALAKAGVL